MTDDARRTPGDLDRELVRIMTLGATRVMGGDEWIYDIANQTSSQLTDPDLFGNATHGGAAYVFWPEVSDQLDAPETPRSKRRREANMDRFARRWSASGWRWTI